jgi:ribosomal protein L14
MVQVQTLLKIIDNSGGWFALCIRILANVSVARPGDEIVLAIKSIILNKKIAHRRKRKVLKGTVRKAVLLRVSYYLKRWGNLHVKFHSNGAALIGRWEMPIGSRINGPVMFESRVSKFIRIAMLSEGSL